MKILPVEAELFHTDGHTDRHDEANSHFSQFANAPTAAGKIIKQTQTLQRN